MATLTRRITRDKLALFLKDSDGRPNHELIKAFENLMEDTIQNGEALPVEIEDLRRLIQESALDGGAARIDAMAALAIAIAAQNLAAAVAVSPTQQPDVSRSSAIDLLSLAPPALSPCAIACECDTSAQLQSVREEVALLRSQVQALQAAPI